MAPQQDTVREDYEKAKADAKTAADELRNDARDAAHNLRSEAEKIAEDQANAARQRVADEVGSLGGALRRAARDLEDGTIQEQAMSRVADGIADLSDNIAGADLRQGVEDLSAYARRQPFAFLGAAALLGFAGARFLKATEKASVSKAAATPAQPGPGDWPEDI